MIVLEIDSVKEFMQHMFQGSMFDRFHLRSCEVTTFATFHIDGRCFDDWFDSDEKRTDETGLVTWNMMKTFVFSWIKGNKVPQKMSFDFCHYMPNGDVGSIQIRYEKEKLQFVTGYMQKEFSLDKKGQQAWDDNCLQFIKKHEIVSTRFE